MKTATTSATTTTTGNNNINIKNQFHLTKKKFGGERSAEPRNLTNYNYNNSNNNNNNNYVGGIL